MKDLVFKKIRISIFQIIMAGAVIVFLLLLIPQFGHVMKISKEAKQKKEVLDYIDQGMSDFQVRELELDELMLSYKSYIDQLPTQEEFPVFLDLLSAKAREHDIKIIAIEPQKVIQEEGMFYVRIPVFVDAVCGYHSLGGFINSLEYSHKLMKIKNIKIESNDANPDKHQVFITVDAFCLKESVNANAGM
ncbi:MAG: type 4a pilus biogenesis protein PilO [Candidatus Omnitrophota bacterium]